MRCNEHTFLYIFRKRLESGLEGVRIGYGTNLMSKHRQGTLYKTITQVKSRVKR